jgi:diguanylate cyclase (GGDEF)-like protein/PAS domain S-box-containing protein
MLHGIYDYGLIALSIAVALFVAYFGLNPAARTTAMRMFSWIALWGRRGRRSGGCAELSFSILADAAPAILWTAQPNGSVDFISDTLYQFTGIRREQALGWGWANSVHPDDVEVCRSRWEHCLGVGKQLEIEYRLRAADGSYRWFLIEGNPVRDQQGRIIKWIGTCIDIEEQRNQKQILEQQIKERTEELAEANTRLQEEMWEKDLARRKLDQQNERMLEDLTARSQRATLLAQMGELLQSCISNDEIFAAALGFAPKIFPTRRGFIALLNGGRDMAEIAGQWHDCEPRVAFEPSSCWALRTGKPHLVVAGDTTAPCAHAAGVKNTYLCIPILAQGEALGILHFQATYENPTLVDSELSLKTTFAGQVGLSVANIRLREALRTQSIKDPLTGLYNRRYLEETMEREIRRAVRAEQGLGVLMLDLDYFKKFNDTHGHDAGDTVLRETASFLLKSVRAEDIVCRFGGEEFVVILPVADLKTTQARAERIRTRLRELTVMHDGQSLEAVTVSVGVAELPQHGTSHHELLAAADAALYRAKREGRDRVAVAETPLTVEVKLT